MKKETYMTIMSCIFVGISILIAIYLTVTDTEPESLSKEVRAEMQSEYEARSRPKEPEVVPVQLPEETSESEIIYIPEETMQYEESGSLIETTDEDILFLEKCVEAEAGNQPLEGRIMVTDVILNRVKDDDFPDKIYEVITQPYRFTSYWNGHMKAAEVSELTRQAVEHELEEVSYPGLYFFDDENYNPYGTPWKRVGDLYFSTK